MRAGRFELPRPVRPSDFESAASAIPPRARQNSDYNTYALIGTLGTLTSSPAFRPGRMSNPTAFPFQPFRATDTAPKTSATDMDSEPPRRARLSPSRQAGLFGAPQAGAIHQIFGKSRQVVCSQHLDGLAGRWTI